jgi:hypothetical protein
MYILITVFLTYNHHSTVVFQEFNTKAACYAAIPEIKVPFQYNSDDRGLHFACVPKG